MFSNLRKIAMVPRQPRTLVLASLVLAATALSACQTMDEATPTARLNPPGAARAAALGAPAAHSQPKQTDRPSLGTVIGTAY